jgi:excisionase family DNA binding protein
MTERLNRSAAAEYCGVSIITIDRALARKAIRHFRIGRRVIFSKAQLDEFLAACEQGQVRPGAEEPEATL